MGKTEKEHLHDSLRMRDGRRLSAHPYNKMLHDLLTLRVDGNKMWASEGEVNKQSNTRKISACVFDIGETLMTIEELNAMLRQSGQEVDDSLKILRDAYNKVKTTKELMFPQLSEMVREVRQMRMTVDQELHQTLQSLREIRAFFLASECLTEMDRLNKFVAVCKEIQSLKTSGVLDAVADLALNLEIGRDRK